MGESRPLQMIDEDDLASGRDDVRRGMRGVVVGLVAIVGLTAFAGGAVGAAVVSHASVVATGLWSAAVAMVLGVPIVWGCAGIIRRRGLTIAAEKAVQSRMMEIEARRRDFETRLGRALEMADDEVGAFDVIERAIATAAPNAPVELLLADNSHAHLEQVVVVAPDGAAMHDCPVDSPDHCVAARRAQTQVFRDSDDLDACPMLREADRERHSAVCVPVSIMGRTVGVAHAAGPIDHPLEDEAIEALQTLANQAGNRLGMLRIMAETQLQASTDGLTGLINRRRLQDRARRFRATGTEFALVMADLDHFKDLNDTHGHETGDRALRIFAETLRSELRSEDVACRYGGEEFVVLLPRADIHDAIDAAGRVRGALARATGRGELPTFTASFGVAHSSEADGFDDLLKRADHALFAAKNAGRDRTCIDGHEIAVSAGLTAIN